MDKWMTIPDMGYTIANRYNVILVCLSSRQNITIFPLRSRPPIDSRQHKLICIGHVHDSHFVQVTQLLYFLFDLQFQCMISFICYRFT